MEHPGMRRALVAGLTGLLLASAAAAERLRFVTPLGAPAPQGAFDSGVRSGAAPIRLDRAKAARSRLGDSLEIALPNATTHEYVFDMLQPHGADLYSWVGYHRNLGTQYRAVITTGPGGSFGSISTPDGEYRIVPGSHGQDWLVDMKAESRFENGSDLSDDTFIPPPSAKRDAAGVPSLKRATPGLNTPYTTLAVPTRTVDVMILYTRGLANRLGGNLMTRLHFLMTQATVAYANSGSDIGVRLVNAMMVDYPDTGSSGTALNAVTPSSGSFNAAAFGGVEAARTAYGADLVALLRNGGSFGGDGVAWLGSASPSPGFMYSVTTGCVLGCESVFIHELGHNMGNQHDRATQAWQNLQQGGGLPGTGPGDYGYGYAFCQAGLPYTCNPEVAGGCTAQPECTTGNGTGGTGTNNFSDIMSYFHASTSKNLKFASPNITCIGNTGPPQACGTALSNAAQKLTDNATAISAVKTQVVADAMPGYVRFADTSFGALEPSGTLEVTLSRAGGSTGAMSVPWSTTDGTARAGQDYTASSGVVNWGAGDAANKTVNIPISSDGINEEGKFFVINLGTPTGNAGAFKAFPSTAYGIVVDTWPLNNVMPAGFTTSGPNAWTLSTDRNYEGPFQMRSAQAFGDFGAPGNSDLEYTGNFREGPVGFAYNVSGYYSPTGGTAAFFEFYVDGTRVLSDFGESGWKYFVYPLSAGNHTLRWRFANEMPSACNGGWNPAPVGGAACADRAWIDAVVLPLASASAKLADINGDGRSDVVYRNNATGQVFRFLANGLALSGGAMAYTEVNTAWRVIGDGDFNGDGVSDLLWRNTTTGQVFVQTFNTSGLPAGGGIVYAEPSASWRIVHTPDLNGDGRADLLWWNSSSGQVYAMLMGPTGLSIQAQGMVYTEPNTQWRIAAVGDFAGSGRANQLLWRHQATGQVYMQTVTHNGGASFSQAGQMIYHEPNTAWQVIGAADFDGNGKSDILYRNASDGRVYVLLMNNGSVAGGGQLHAEPNTQWKVISHGDYNGDGRADLLWRNDSSGQLYMMLTAAGGVTVATQGVVYNEANTAWFVLGPWVYAQ